MSDATTTPPTLDLPEGVEVTADLRPGDEEILSRPALELIATLHRQLEQRRQERLAARQEVVRAVADGQDLDFLAEWGPDVRRRMIAEAVAAARQRGTVAGLKRIVQHHTGLADPIRKEGSDVAVDGIALRFHRAAFQHRNLLADDVKALRFTGWQAAVAELGREPGPAGPQPPPAHGLRLTLEGGATPLVCDGVSRSRPA